MVTLFTLGIICLAAVILIPVILFLVGLPFLLLMGLLPWLLRIAGVGAAHQGPARQAHPLGKLHARRRGLCPVPAHRLDLLSAGRPLPVQRLGPQGRPGAKHRKRRISVRRRAEAARAARTAAPSSGRKRTAMPQPREISRSTGMVSTSATGRSTFWA